MAWVRPSSTGIAIKTADEAVVPAITNYFTLRGGRCFSFTQEVLQGEDGTRIIKERSISPSEAGYFKVLARTLTFHPANSDQWIFRPTMVDSGAFMGAKIIGGNDWKCDLLSVTPNPIPHCNCPCGATYPVGSKRCPSCYGDDPLGYAISACGGDLPALLSATMVSLTDPVQDYPEIQKLASSLQGFLKRASEPPEADVSKKPDKATAKLLLAYFRKLFSLPKVSAGSFSALSKLREAKYLAIVMDCASRSGAIRKYWNPSSLGAWAPESAFQQATISRLGDAWEKPLQDLREAFMKIFATAALFKPVERPIRAVADRGLLGNLWHAVVRPALTLVGAYSTWGVSLAVKGCFAYIKSEKAHKQFALFSEALSAAIVASQAALDSVRVARESEIRLRNQISNALGIHLQNLLFADYAYASPTQQTNLSISLLSGLKIDASGMSQLKKRGPETLKRRRLRFYSIAIVALLTLLLLGWLILQ